MGMVFEEVRVAGKQVLERNSCGSKFSHEGLEEVLGGGVGGRELRFQNMH
jgi:hypothetical protein